MHPLESYEATDNMVQGYARRMPDIRPQWLQDAAKYLNDSPLTQALGSGPIKLLASILVR